MHSWRMLVPLHQRLTYLNAGCRSASPQDQEFASAPNAFRSTGPVPVIIPGPRIDEKDTWRQLAGNADVLYMDATTAAARSEHSRCVNEKVTPQN